MAQLNNIKVLRGNIVYINPKIAKIVNKYIKSKSVTALNKKEEYISPFI
jgi:hypothetical protein